MFAKFRAAAKASRKQGQFCDVAIKDRIYIPQGCVGILRHFANQYVGPQYLSTSGIAPCIGITIYSFITRETTVILGHFDSSNGPNIGEYIELIVRIAELPSSMVKVTVGSIFNFFYCFVKIRYC